VKFTNERGEQNEDLAADGFPAGFRGGCYGSNSGYGRQFGKQRSPFRKC
jgi:hypothetical protein